MVFLKDSLACFKQGFTNFVLLYVVKHVLSYYIYRIICTWYDGDYPW